MQSPAEQRGVNHRYLLVMAVLAACVIGVTIQLVSLQVIHGADCRRKLDKQSVRMLWVPALRGKVKVQVSEQKMQVLADNRPAFDIELMVSDLSMRQRSNTVRNLAVLLRMPEATIWTNLQPDAHFPYTPARVAHDVPFGQMLQVAERLNDLPGVDVVVNPVRSYPYGKSVCHAIGYVGKVAPDHPKLLEGEYSMHDLVGKTGIEFECERSLHGQNGRRNVRVDRSSRYVETFWQQPPLPGQDVVLTLHLALQRALEDALSNRTGAAVAIDPHNGDVLALVSSPSYDNNAFAGGISASAYAALTTDPERPLVNRATCGQYQLGSVFKLITAIAALQSGALTKDTVFNDPGYFELGDMRVDNFRKHRYGALTLPAALRVSCNSFFCTYSLTVGVTRLVEHARLFRFGSPTGIEIAEASGLLPDQGWKRGRFNESWFPGDTVNLAIGQGYLLVTPLQVACMVGAIANGGTWFPPHLIRGTLVGTQLVLTRKAQPPVPIPVRADTLETVRQGMWEVVNAKNGSGRLACLNKPVVAGKTGSAMRGDETFGWFAGYAPFDDPQIAMAVVVEHADTGGKDAAPIFRRGIAAFFGVNLATATNQMDHSSLTD